MQFARWVFRLAAIYGVIVLTPLYFVEPLLGAKAGLTHPESHYGFVGAALAFQALFFVISTDPARYRAAMLAGVLEKASFPAAVIPLWLAGRTPGGVAVFATIDLCLGVLFLASWLRTRPAAPDQGVSAEAVSTGGV